MDQNCTDRSCGKLCGARTRSGLPAAVSLARVVGTSHVIRSEDCNVRFYGVLFALIALAAFLAVRLGDQESAGRPLLVANTCTQAALVLCFAVICSNKRLLCLQDRFTRRFWNRRPVKASRGRAVLWEQPRGGLFGRLFSSAAKAVSGFKRSATMVSGAAAQALV